MNDEPNERRRRVAVFGTGNVGAHALRAVHARRDLDLVAVRVYSAAKSGRDAGEVIGAGRWGLSTCDDVDQVLAAQPEAVLYMPNSPDEQELLTLLRAGVNVVSTSGSHMFYPYRDTELIDQLESACQDGRSSFFGTGVDPGYLSTQLPLALAGWCARVDRVKLTEVALMVDYPSAATLFDLMHFGQPLSPDNCDRGPIGERIGRAFEAQVAQLVAGLGARLQRIDRTYDEVAAPRPLEVAAGTIAEGTVAGQRWRWSGIVDDAPLAEIEVIWIMADDLPGWPAGFGWTIDVDGDPAVRTTLHMSGGVNHDDEACTATAMLAVNSVASVCEAAPGLRLAADLPPVRGRYVGRGATQPRVKL